MDNAGDRNCKSEFWVSDLPQGEWQGTATNHCKLRLTNQVNDLGDKGYDYLMPQLSSRENSGR